METREVLGLDDQGRELICFRTTDSSGDFGTEVVMAFEKPSGHMTIVQQRTYIDELEMAQLRSAQSDAAFMSDMKRGMGRTIWGSRGSGKSSFGLSLYGEMAKTGRAMAATHIAKSQQKMPYDIFADFSRLEQRAVQALVSDVQGAQLANLPAVAKNPHNIMMFDESVFVTNEAWLGKTKAKFKKRKERKPQPNRGPVGKKDWK